MAVNYRHGLSILELIFYFPVIFVSLWMAFRHGFTRSAGWIFFTIFALLKVIGACCYLDTIQKPDSKNLYTTWAVCTSIGLGPLIQACISLLSRANNSIGRVKGQGITPFFFRIPGAATIVGIVFSIIGATKAKNLIANMATSDTKIGLILFLAAWGGLGLLQLLLMSKIGSMEMGERRLLVAVGLSLPLILVRLVYSFVWIFGQNSDFSMFTGNVTIYLVMVVLEQIAVVAICLGVGVTLKQRN
ncbi:hypothetical protein ATERTT37_002203 [Aspergillus terreus]